MQCGFLAQNDDDNIAQADTLHSIHKVSFLALQNDWAVTFPNTVEGKGSDTDIFNIYRLFDAPQGRSRCSSYTTERVLPFESENMFFCLEITFSCSKSAHHWEGY